MYDEKPIALSFTKNITSFVGSFNNKCKDFFDNANRYKIGFTLFKKTEDEIALEDFKTSLLLLAKIYNSVSIKYSSNIFIKDSMLYKFAKNIGYSTLSVVG